VRRLRRRKQEPPESFPLIGFGLLAGAAGAVINAGIAWNLIRPSLDILGKRLYTEGMVLLLVLGVGGFLGPRLLGFAALPQFLPGAEAPVPNRRIFLYKVAGAAVLLSLVAEYGLGLSWMVFARAAVATAIILSAVQPWKFPVTRTTLAWCVWAAFWLITSSLWLVAIAPRYRIDLLHVLFIGGFTLLILAVGTRVTLSHGGLSLALERASWPLRVGVITGLVAMLTRISAPLAPAAYFLHLAVAALMWIGGILFWGFYLWRWTTRGPVHNEGR
jgi:hypothetical protein